MHDFVRQWKSVKKSCYDRGPLYLGTKAGKVEQQLTILSKDHVAYSSKRFKASSGETFSVVGGRPFSDVCFSLPRRDLQLKSTTLVNFYYRLSKRSQQIRILISSQPLSQLEIA